MSSDLCDYAARHGLKIGMETDSNMLPTAAIGIAILDRIDRPEMLGFNYDPGNVVYYTGADPIEDISYRPAADGPFPFQGQDRRQGRLQLPASGRRRTRHAGCWPLRRGRIHRTDQRRGRVRRKRLAGLRDLPGRRQTSVANLHAMGLSW